MSTRSKGQIAYMNRGRGNNQLNRDLRKKEALEYQQMLKDISNLEEEISKSQNFNKSSNSFKHETHYAEARSTSSSQSSKRTVYNPSFVKDNLGSFATNKANKENTPVYDMIRNASIEIECNAAGRDKKPRKLDSNSALLNQEDMDDGDSIHELREKIHKLQLKDAIQRQEISKLKRQNEQINKDVTDLEHKVMKLEQSRKTVC